MKFRNFVPALAFLIIAILMAISTGLQNKPNFMHSMVGKEIPEFQTKLLGSEENFSDKDLKKQPSIVNFWASWCVSCKGEHSELLLLQKEGYKIYGISSADPAEQAKEYLHELGNPFEKIAVDPRRKLAVAFGTIGLPETFVIGTDGVITYHFRGALTASQLVDVKKAYAETK